MNIDLFKKAIQHLGKKHLVKKTNKQLGKKQKTQLGKKTKKHLRKKNNKTYQNIIGGENPPDNNTEEIDDDYYKGMQEYLSITENETFKPLVFKKKNGISFPKDMIFKPFEQVKTSHKIKGWDNIVNYKGEPLKATLEEKEKKTGGGRKIDWIVNITDTLIRAFQRESGWTDAEMCSVSIFNPSISWIRTDERTHIDYYIVSSRIIFYTAKNESKGINKRQANDFYKLGINLRQWAYMGDFPEEQELYCRTPGSNFNKWFNAKGSWKVPDGFKQHEYTHLAVFARQGHDFNIVSAITIPFVIDARVLNLWNELHSGNEVINSFSITGSRTNNTQYPSRKSVECRQSSHTHLVDPKRDESTRENGDLVDDHHGWKQQILNFTIIQNIEDGNSIRFEFPIPNNPSDARDTAYVRPPMPTYASALANTISWIDNPYEKNYALYHYRDTYRNFAPLILLQYHMHGGAYQNQGMIFYLHSYNIKREPYKIPLLENPSDRTEYRSWHLRLPANSDIFDRIHNDPKYQHKLHISCTTPFMDLDDDNKLYAVGHMKINMWEYLDQRLRIYFGISPDMAYQMIPDHDMNRAINQLKNEPDHLFKSGLSIIDWGAKQLKTALAERNKLLIIQINHPHQWPKPGPQQVSYLTQKHWVVGELCRQRELIFFRNNTSNDITHHATSVHDMPITLRNWHPNLMYYMFLYRINKETLELESFSHPFMILKDNTAAALNFPMGLTTNHIYRNGHYEGEKHIWLSYGEGDCQCHIAAFTKSKFKKMVKQCNNRTDINSLEFRVFKDRDI